MDKNNIIELIDRIFCPYGYKRTGIHWVKKINNITKILNLNKSYFGNKYYMDAGIILDNLELSGLASHVMVVTPAKGIFQIDEENVSEIVILSDMKNTLNTLLKALENINSEDEVLMYIKNDADLSCIPLIVKKYFNLYF